MIYIDFDIYLDFARAALYKTEHILGFPLFTEMQKSLGSKY